MAKVVRTKALVVFLLSVFMHFSRMSGLGINELLYFRVISPEEIGYIFSAAPAKDFGGDFTSSYDEIFLVPADPADGCSELEDREIIQGQVVLVERGCVSIEGLQPARTRSTWATSFVDRTVWPCGPPCGPRNETAYATEDFLFASTAVPAPPPSCCSRP